MKIKWEEGKNLNMPLTIIPLIDRWYLRFRPTKTDLHMYLEHRLEEGD